MAVDLSQNANKVIDINEKKRKAGKDTLLRLVFSSLALGGVLIVLRYVFKIDILRGMQDLFMLKYLPKLGNDTGLGILFIFGVLTSFHCIGMCGGIAISQTVGQTQSKHDIRKGAWLLPSTLYNLGRIISYTVVGGLVGGAGQVLSFNGALKGIVPIIGGIFMIIMGINLLGIFPFLRRFTLHMPSFFAKKIKSGKNYGPFYVGLLSGLMPCGPLQMVELYALGSKSAIVGAVSMFIFSIGTVPALFVFGAINTVINKKFSNIILKFSAVLVVILGTVMIGRGLSLSGISISMPHFMEMKVEEGVAKIEGSIQTVVTHVSSGSYPAIKVRKGIPVKWILKADKENLNDCNNAIVIPKFKIEKKLEAGDNLVEFTPLETGDIVFTCWMGMIKSKITVVDRIESSTTTDSPKSTTNNSTIYKAECTNDQEQGFLGVIKEATPTPTGNNLRTPGKSESPKSSGTMSNKENDEASHKTTISPNSEKKVESGENPTGHADNYTGFKKGDTGEISKTGAQETRWVGILQDKHCFGLIDPEKDSKFCLNMPECVASGYGIAVKQQDHTYKFYLFDQKGHDLAKEILKKTSGSKNIVLTVKGVWNSEIIKTISITEGN